MTNYNVVSVRDCYSASLKKKIENLNSRLTEANAEIVAHTQEIAQILAEPISQDIPGLPDRIAGIKKRDMQIIAKNLGLFKEKQSILDECRKEYEIFFRQLQERIEVRKSEILKVYEQNHWPLIAECDQHSAFIKDEKYNMLMEQYYEGRPSGLMSGEDDSRRMEFENRLRNSVTGQLTGY